MTVGDLYKELKEIVDVYGDREVYVHDEFGSYSPSFEVIESGMIKENENAVIIIN